MKRESVKVQDRSNRERTLQRLRSECTERFAKDRSALKERLRNSIDTAGLETVIRQGIHSVRSKEDEINEEDIDRLVDEFLNELRDRDEPVFDDTTYTEALASEQSGFTHDWVKCPLCWKGFLLIPFPGVIACDACSEMQMGLPNEQFSVHDFASALDHAIRSHQQRSPGCSGSLPFFSLYSSGLVLSCAKCGSVDGVHLVNR